MYLNPPIGFGKPQLPILLSLLEGKSRTTLISLTSGSGICNYASAFPSGSNLTSLNKFPQAMYFRSPTYTFPTWCPRYYELSQSVTSSCSHMPMLMQQPTPPSSGPCLWSFDLSSSKDNSSSIHVFRYRPKSRLFRRVRNEVANIRLLASLCLPVSLWHITTQKLNGFVWNLIFRSFT